MVFVKKIIGWLIGKTIVAIEVIDVRGINSLFRFSDKTGVLDLRDRGVFQHHGRESGATAKGKGKG